MELPLDVLIHNKILGIQGSRGELVRISEHGYYEVDLVFGERAHRVLLPVADTVIIERNPREPDVEADFEIER